MAKKKKNPLDFTGLDYDSIRTKIQYALDQDPRFETFRESSIAKTVLDLFAGCTDITNYYLSRRAEESFLDTARLRSSVISLSKMLGYVPRRPIPAKSGAKIIINGPLPSALTAGETVTFTKLTNDDGVFFTGSDMPFGLKNSYTYIFTNNDIVGGVGNPSWSKEISYAINLSASDAPYPLDDVGSVDPRYLTDIELLQGEFKTEIIYGNGNPQTGQLFQKYKISDKTLSNFYGEEDLGYDTVTSEANLEENLMKVGIGVNLASALSLENLYTVARRSLIDPNQISPDDSSVPKTALVSTNMDEGVTLYFGDDVFANKGIPNASNNVYVKYWSTKGANGNKVGVITEDLISSNSFITNENNLNITNNIKFKFFRNITNGSDLESIDSIRLNAPEIFYSLDRLITSRDYISYLKTRTVGSTGGQVKNAIAWGEQEEVSSRGELANYRFFNVIFFSVLGEIYNFPVGGEYTIKNDENIHQAYLEEEADFSSIVESTSGVVSANGYPEQSYFNILVKGVPHGEIARVQDFRSLQTDHPITLMYNNIDKRSQMTVKDIYISPMVQKMNLKGRVTIGKLEDRVSVRKRINNFIYEWLNDNADFKVNIQKSQITKMIDDEPEVVSSNIYFEANLPTKLITTFESDPDFVAGTDASTSAAIKTIYDDAIINYLTSAGFANVKSTESTTNSDRLSIYDVPEVSGASIPTSAGTLSTSASSTAGIWNNPFSDGTYLDFWYEYKAHLRVGNINEFTFYSTLMKDVYDNLQLGSVALQTFSTSQYFKNIMFKMHNDLVGPIVTSMLDSEGNIVNYSLRNEIVQVNVDLTYIYDSE